MSRKSQQGTVVLFLETDLDRAKPFDESSLNATQKQYFSKLSETERGKIRAGYGTIISDLETNETLCKFNMETYFPPKHALESFARMIYPYIQEYYSHEENRVEFEQQRAKKKKKK